MRNCTAADIFPLTTVGVDKRGVTHNDAIGCSPLTILHHGEFRIRNS
jgi:hypothetical protein